MARRGPRQYRTSSEMRPATVETGASRIYKLDTLTLRATYPCCNGPARFVAIDAIPKEQYARTCGQCGTKWTVTRQTLSDVHGVRLDRLEWDTSYVDLYAVNRRALVGQKEVR
jgi:hypothetical protein